MAKLGEGVIAAQQERKAGKIEQQVGAKPTVTAVKSKRRFEEYKSGLAKYESDVEEYEKQKAAYESAMGEAEYRDQLAQAGYAAGYQAAATGKTISGDYPPEWKSAWYEGRKAGEEGGRGYAGTSYVSGIHKPETIQRKEYTPAGEYYTVSSSGVKTGPFTTAQAPGLKETPHGLMSFEPTQAAIKTSAFGSKYIDITKPDGFRAYSKAYGISAKELGLEAERYKGFEYSEKESKALSYQSLSVGGMTFAPEYSKYFLRQEKQIKPDFIQHPFTWTGMTTKQVSKKALGEGAWKFFTTEPGEEFYKAAAGYPEVLRPSWKEQPIQRLKTEFALGGRGGLEAVKWAAFKPYKAIKEEFIKPTGELVSKKVHPYAAVPFQFAGELTPTTPLHLASYMAIGGAFKYAPRVTQSAFIGTGAWEFHKAETPLEYFRAGVLVTAGVAPTIIKKVSAKTQVSRDLSKMVKEGKLTKAQASQFKLQLKQVRKLESQTLKTPSIKDLDFSGMKKFPKKLHGVTKAYIKSKGDITGGSIAMRSQLKVKVLKGRFLKSDIDLYTTGKPSLRAAELANIWRKAGAKRVSLVPGTGKITIAGEKVAEYHGRDMLYGNIESVSTWYKPSSSFIKQTPGGIKVGPTLDIQTQRNIIRYFMEATDKTKHLKDVKLGTGTFQKQIMFEQKIALPDPSWNIFRKIKVKKAPRVFSIPEIDISPPPKSIVSGTYKPFLYPTYPKYPSYSRYPIYSAAYPKYQKAVPYRSPKTAPYTFPVTPIKITPYPKKPPYKPTMPIPYKPPKKPPFKPVIPIPYKPPKKPPYKTPPYIQPPIVPSPPTKIPGVPRKIIFFPKSGIGRKRRKKKGKRKKTYIRRKPSLWALGEKITSSKPFGYEKGGLQLRPIFISKPKKKRRKKK